MPVLSNPKHERFAQEYAKSGNAAESYVSAGYAETGARQAASRLLTNVDVHLRVEELKQIIADGVVKLEIGLRSERVRAQQERWNKMRAVIEARALDPMVVLAPGGSTGLLVRQLKMLGSGPLAQVTEEFAVDTGLLREIREIEKQAAIEVGQWTEKNELTGANGGPIDNNVNVRFVE